MCTLTALGLVLGNSDVRSHVVAAGVKVNSTVPAPYRTTSTKNAKERDTYPWSPSLNLPWFVTVHCSVVLGSDSQMTLETRTFGVRHLSCHCIFDDWISKPTWRKAAQKVPRHLPCRRADGLRWMQADGRCAVVVTSFVEGVTARRADADVFFVLALKIGSDEFVILTTDAKKTELLSERAIKSDGFGSGRCPLYADGAQAALWVSEVTSEAPEQTALEIDKSTRANQLGLVLGAAQKALVKPAGQRSIASLWGTKSSAPKAAASKQSQAPVEPPAKKPRRDESNGEDAPQWSCKVCTLLNDLCVSTCVVCGNTNS